MDYHALQQKLFDIEPSNPVEDLAKLQAQAGGSDQPSSPQPIVESYQVPEGSLQMDKDYSVADFAALAGVKLTEAPVQPAQAQQQVGMGAKMVGNKIGAKGGASQMAKGLDKLGQGQALPANLAKQIAPFAKQLGTILGNQQMRTKFMQLIKQAEKAAAPAAQPAAQPKAAPAAQAAPESIREELERRLKDYKKKS